VLLAALCIALLGVSIAALVIARDAQSSVNSLGSAIGTGQLSGSPSVAAASDQGAATPAVYASTSPVPPEGYLSAGSLYRGSGEDL
jgi:hypothetical protein